MGCYCVHGTMICDTFDFLKKFIEVYLAYNIVLVLDVHDALIYKYIAKRLPQYNFISHRYIFKIMSFNHFYPFCSP